MKSNKNNNMIFFLFALIIFACSEILLVEITINYPFDDEGGELFTFNADEGIREVDQTIRDMSSDALGVEITLDQLLEMVEKTELDTIPGTDKTLEDFKEEVLGSDNLEWGNAEMELVMKDGALDMIRVIIRNDPFPLVLSDNKDISDYLEYKSKIYSATINNLKFILENSEFLQGFGDGGEPELDIRADLFAMEWDKAAYVNPDGTFNKTDNPMYNQVYSRDKGCINVEKWYRTMEDKNAVLSGEEMDLYEECQKSWIGAIQREAITQQTEDLELNLEYTYGGKNVLQDAIKSIDFQIGSIIQINIGKITTLPKGDLSAKIEGEFFFSVEPLN